MYIKKRDCITATSSYHPVFFQLARSYQEVVWNMEFQLHWYVEESSYFTLGMNIDMPPKCSESVRVQCVVPYMR